MNPETFMVPRRKFPKSDTLYLMFLSVLVAIGLYALGRIE